MRTLSLAFAAFLTFAVPAAAQRAHVTTSTATARPAAPACSDPARDGACMRSESMQPIALFTPGAEA